MEPSSSIRGRPRYGVDAPDVMAGFTLSGSGGVLAGLLVTVLVPAPFSYAGWVLAAVSAVPLFFGLMMVVYALVGKRRTRAHLLRQVSWRGDERVLDVGTGAGFLLVGAAQAAPRAEVVGIDGWSAKDLSNNSKSQALRNAALEGVAERVEVVTGDARKLPFADGEFDVAVTLLCIHNIKPKADQAQACREIARVLKPGGRVIIGDYVPTHGYAAALAESGLTVRQSRQAFGVALGLMWVLVADKVA